MLNKLHLHDCTSFVGSYDIFNHYNDCLYYTSQRETKLSIYMYFALHFSVHVLQRAFKIRHNLKLWYLLDFRHTGSKIYARWFTQWIYTAYIVDKPKETSMRPRPTVTGAWWQ